MQRKTKFVWTEWMIAAVTGVGFLAALLLPIVCALGEDRPYPEQKLLHCLQNGEIVRLHVIANSDSPIDQAIKLYVRDAVVFALEEIVHIKVNQSADAVYEVLCHSVNQIEKTAETAARSVGCKDSIVTEAGVFDLPAKACGSVVLPQGKYRAVRIIIGKGEGKNWWCVLFPKLCSSLSENESLPGPGIRWHSRRILANWLCSLPSSLQVTENML